MVPQSSSVALSWVKRHAADLKLSQTPGPGALSDVDLHLHFPSGKNLFFRNQSILSNGNRCYQEGWPECRTGDLSQVRLNRHVGSTVAHADLA